MKKIFEKKLSLLNKKIQVATVEQKAMLILGLMLLMAVSFGAVRAFAFKNEKEIAQYKTELISLKSFNNDQDSEIEDENDQLSDLENNNQASSPDAGSDIQENSADSQASEQTPTGTEQSSGTPQSQDSGSTQENEQSSQSVTSTPTTNSTLIPTTIPTAVPTQVQENNSVIPTQIPVTITPTPEDIKKTIETQKLTVTFFPTNNCPHYASGTGTDLVKKNLNNYWDHSLNLNLKFTEPNTIYQVWICGTGGCGSHTSAIFKTDDDGNANVSANLDGIKSGYRTIEVIGVEPALGTCLSATLYY